MIEIKQKVRFTTGKSQSRQVAKRPPTSADVPVGRIPRISKLMALAIRFDGLIQSSTVADQSELACLAKVTQPRMTQIMNLLRLAPDIQEELLFLPRVTAGKAAIHEKRLRPIAAQTDWARQRAMWLALKAAAL